MNREGYDKYMLQPLQLSWSTGGPSFEHPPYGVVYIDSSFLRTSITVLVGGWGKPPLKNMSSSIGMMTFPIYGKIKMATKPPTSNDEQIQMYVKATLVRLFNTAKPIINRV